MIIWRRQLRTGALTARPGSTGTPVAVTLVMPRRPPVVPEAPAAFDASIPDVILPIQYFDRLTARTSDVPERRLLFAVLLDAVLQLQRRNCSAAADAERWVRGEDGAETVFSFVHVCDTLGIDPDYLRRGLLAWRARRLKAARMRVRRVHTSERRVTPVDRRRALATPRS